MRSFTNTVAHWTAGSHQVHPEYGWIKFAKYKFAAFIHAVTAQADRSPPPPWVGEFHDLPSSLCTGAAQRWLTSHILGGRADRRHQLQGDTRRHFLATIGKVKTACPRPGLMFLKASIDKTVVALSTSKPVPAPLRLTLRNGQTTEVDHERMLATLRRTVDEIMDCRSKKEVKANMPIAFRQYEDRQRFRAISASTKSTFAHSRNKGGNMADVTKFIKDQELLRAIAPLIMAEKDDEYSPLSDFTIFFSEAFQPADEDHIFGCVIPSQNTIPTYEADLRRVELASQLLYQSALTSACVLGLGLVKPVALAEALKARVITAGEGLTTKALHPLQKWMWQMLQRHKTFVLTGRTVSARLVEEQIGSDLLEGEFYISGDYSAATDNLASWVSECIANRIADNGGLTDEERLLFLRSLTGNTLCLKDKETGVVSSHEQKWGQLMGSIVSFPVLCIANAAMTRLAIEIGRGRRLKLQDCHMLINGDDVCFKSDFQTYKFWEQITGFGGLESSLGKTYVTREFVQINSRNYWRLPEPRYEIYDTTVNDDDGEPTNEVVFRPQWLHDPGFVNFGLLSGMKRSEEAGKEDVELSLSDVQDSDDTIGMRAEKLLQDCPSELREVVYQRFVNRHRTVLEQAKVPWYIPTKLGGAGLPHLPTADDTADSRRFGPSAQNLCVVARLLRDKTKDGGPKYPVHSLPKAVDWFTHKLVLDSIPKQLLSYGTPTEADDRTWGQVYGALCFAQMFAPEALKRLCPSTNKGDKTAEKAAKRRRQVLRKNEQSWVDAGKAKPYPAPVPLHTLQRASQEKPILAVSALTTLYPPKRPKVVGPDPTPPVEVVD